MAKYRDAEVILGPIRRNYRSRGCLYYIVEDCLSGMEYYIEYRCPVLGKKTPDFRWTEDRKTRCAGVHLVFSCAAGPDSAVLLCPFEQLPQHQPPLTGTAFYDRI